MTNEQEGCPAAQALGIIAAVIERRCRDLSPTRVARLAESPQTELAILHLEVSLSTAG